MPRATVNGPGDGALRRHLRALIAAAAGLCLACSVAAQTNDPGAQKEAERLQQEGVALVNKDRPADALAPLEKALALYVGAVGEKDRRIIAVLQWLSYANYKLARYPESLAYDERRLKAAVAALGEKDPATIRALRDIAISYENVYPDGYARALPLLRRALPLAVEASGERDSFSQTLMVDLANAYRFTGRYSEALALYERQARAVAQQYGAEDPRAVQALLVVAIAYGDLGREAEALPIFEETHRLTLQKQGERSRDGVFSMVRLGAAYENAGRIADGVRLLERAMELRKTVFPEKDREAIYIGETLGQAYLKAGRAAEALPLFEQALKLNIEDAGGDERSFVALNSLENLARTFSALGRHEEARALHEKTLALRIEVRGEGHPDTLGSRLALARALEKLGSPREAAAQYEKLVPAVEALRASGDLSPENRQALFSQWVGAYKSYARLLVAEGRAAEAFRLAELSKARTLLESTAMRRANQSSVLEPVEADRVRNYEKRIAGLSDSIAASRRAEQRFALESEKNKTVAELAELRRELSAKYPKYAQLSDVRIAGAESGKAVLPPDAVLLSYLLDGDRGVVFALSEQGLAAAALDSLGNLDETIENYRQRISDPELSRAAGAARKMAEDLGAKLLGPVTAQLAGKQHVIVSPDGALALLPFETLVIGDKTLIAAANVSYTQSLSMMVLLKERDAAPRSGESRDLFAMGGAIYGARDAGTGGARGAGRTRGTADPGADIRRMLSAGATDPSSMSRAFEAMNLKWIDLPGSVQEVEAVAKVFGADRSSVYKERDATEAKLIELNASNDLARYRYLLFSAHGYLSTEEPGLSSLVLGQLNKAPGTDGYVSAGEWPGYNLASDLVVLSACDTGVGRVVQGEGVTGLPYALFVAGNRNTLLSLWPVVDQSTQRFMTAFFSRLHAGVAQAVALSETKREFLATPEFNRPLFWAPFVLYGY